MKNIRRIAALVAVFISGVAAFLLTGSQAFAVNVSPAGGGRIIPSSPVAHQGTSAWEMAFIALAAVVFLALSATLVRIRVLVPRRPATA